MSFSDLLRRLFRAPRPAASPTFQISYAPVVELDPALDLAIVSPRADVRGDLSRCYAYLSFTELPAALVAESGLPAEAIARHNPRWDSWVVDIRHPAWERILLAETEAALGRGYSRLFLDTVDGLDLLALDGPLEQRAIHDRAVELLARVAGRVPGGLLMNRGFTLYEAAKPRLDGIFIESYFFKRVGNDWVRRGRSDLQWLRERVSRARADGKFVLALDYAPLTEAECAAFRAEAAREGVSWRVAREELQ